MLRAVFIGIALLWLAAPGLVLAADLVPTSMGTVQLSVSPSYPRPGDTVTVTATDYSGNADALTYVWSVGDAVVLQGPGERVLTLTAGPEGSVQAVNVITVLNGSPQSTATAVIRPSDIDLVWEGNTSTPPFYIGRPLPNAQSRVTVLAMPHVASGKAELPASTLIYRWKVNGLPLTEASGYGKQLVSLAPPAFTKPFTVSVLAETSDGIGVAQNEITITPQAPAALMYEDAPLLGVRFEKTVPAAFPMTGNEASFAAFPLFVSDPGALSYQWTLDGAPFSVDPKAPRTVTFRKSGGGSGMHPVTFSFKNGNAFSESASVSFALTF